MDIRLPGMNGLEATQRIMSVRPTPIVVIAGSVASGELNIGIEALRAGALAVLEKPVGVTHADYELFSERICTQLAIMSQVRVVRQRLVRDFDLKRGQPEIPVPVKPLRSALERYAMLGIVASTGGPNAVVQVLGGLGREFPLPIVLVQHITASFLESFVTWLSGVCPFKAVIAKHNDVPEPGKVYVAAADRHLHVDGGCLKLDASAPVSFQRPSGTVLFESMARSLGPRALGVLLTGMGDDGARGLLAMREAGGFTIAEDESTAVVYGMPAEAVRLNAVCELQPLPLIAPMVLERIRGE